AVALEELRRGVSYSNNVGFYKSAFYLFPPPTTGAPPPVRARRAPPAVQLEKVEVLSRDGRRVRHASPNESVIVSTALHTGAEPLRGGLTILFYDGHRASGVPAFDVERMPYLRADDTYDVRVPFRSSICGRHVLAVVADPGTAFERTRQTRVHVKCREGEALPSAIADPRRGMAVDVLERPRRGIAQAGRRTPAHGPPDTGRGSPQGGTTAR